MKPAAPPNPMERISLRVRRFMGTVNPKVRAVDRALAEEWLPPRLLALFATQDEADQRHGIAVARLLLRSGYASRDLIAAALLHDAGKRDAHFTPWHRTAIVVLECLAPWVLRRLARRRRGPILAPFAVHAMHAALGADMASAAGAPSRVAHLIRGHHGYTCKLDEEMCMLRWADIHA